MSELRQLQELLREAQTILDHLTGDEAERMAELREQNRQARNASYRPRVIDGPVGTGDSRGQ